MKFISRGDWGAPPTTRAAALTTARGVAVHYLGTAYPSRPHAECAAYVRSTRDAHLRHPTENYLDIAYNLLACEHGYVFEGRGVRRRSGANGTAAANTSHYAICALHGTSGSPSDGLLGALRDGIEHLRASGAGDEVTGHRDHRPTACPGDALYAWVRSGAPRPGGSAGTYTVRAGDTLWGIARAHDVTVDQLRDANSIRGDLIHPGDELAIPSGTSSQLAPKPKPRPPAYEPFPGAAFFRVGRNSAIVTAMGRRLVAEGCSRYRVGPGPRWSTVDQASYAAWQRKLGFTGQDADGIPGRTSWDRLRVPKS
jgi:hypothetical protein